MEKTILILGATGTLGKVVAKKLSDDGYKVRVLVRDVSKANDIFDDKIEIIQGDANNPADINYALEGCFGVHHSVGGEAELLCTKNLIEVASNHQLKKITYISGTTVSEENAWYEMIRRKLESEKLIINSGFTYSIFRPTFFIDVLHKHIKGNKAFIFGKNPASFHWLTANDLAKIVSNSYSNPASDNKIFYLHGVEKLNYKDALNKYIEALHPEVEKISTFSFATANIIGTLFGKKAMKDSAKMYAYFEKTPEMGDPSETFKIFGKPEFTIDQWLEMMKKNKA